MRILTYVLASITLLSGCATNPVTGRKEIQLVSETKEIQLGQQNFLPAQQSQGGVLNAFPELNGYVANVGQSLANVSDRPHLPYEFVILNNPIPNAWAMPGGKIALNRGLLVELKDEAELAAVLGHEIVHAAARHAAKNIGRGILIQTGLIGLGMSAENHDYKDIIVGVGGLTASLVGLKYGRYAEFEADRYGMRYMARAKYDPSAAVNLQQTFLRLAEGKSQSWMEGLFASHPPSQDRVEANRKIAASMPQGGMRNKSEFQAAIGPLKKALHSYDKLENGYKALGKGQADTALRLATEAIQIEPGESLFYLLAAKAKTAQNNLPHALDNLEKAIERNDQYFDHYLQRGLIRNRLGYIKQAQKDFDLSIKLLPTAEAHLNLGYMSLSKGKEDQALEHFRIAASSKSKFGKESLGMLTKLDLPNHPERYIQVSALLDADRYLRLTASNRSPLPVAPLVISVEIYNLDGQFMTRSQITFSNRIPSGSSAHATTQIGPFINVEHVAQSVRLKIIAAHVPES